MLSADLAHLVENNQRLNDELRKKTRHAEYYLAEWQKLKQLHMTADVGAAAEHTAENVVQETAAYSQRIANHERPLGMPPYRSTSKGSVGSGGDRQRRMTRAFATGDHQNYAREYHPQSSRAGFGTSRTLFGALFRQSANFPQRASPTPRKAKAIDNNCRCQLMVNMLRELWMDTELYIRVLREPQWAIRTHQPVRVATNLRTTRATTLASARTCGQAKNNTLCHRAEWQAATAAYTFGEMLRKVATRVFVARCRRRKLSSTLQGERSLVAISNDSHLFCLIINLADSA